MASHVIAEVMETCKNQRLQVGLADRLLGRGDRVVQESFIAHCLVGYVYFYYE